MVAVGRRKKKERRGLVELGKVGERKKGRTSLCGRIHYMNIASCSMRCLEMRKIVVVYSTLDEGIRFESLGGLGVQNYFINPRSVIWVLVLLVYTLVQGFLYVRNTHGIIGIYVRK